MLNKIYEFHLSLVMLISEKCFRTKVSSTFAIRYCAAALIRTREESNYTVEDENAKTYGQIHSVKRESLYEFRQRMN